MKAITCRRYGPPDVLRLEELPRPEPGDDEVLIRVRAVEATKGDCELRGFRFAVKWFWLPLRLVMGVRRPRRPVPGGYFAGVVERVGRAVQTLSPGDEVVGCTNLRFGAYAEYLCLPARYPLAPKPAAMSFEAAAALPLGGLNAHHFLKLAGLAAGEHLLVNGAGGSIGAYGIQIAKALGAEVTAVDRGYKADGLKTLGAEHVLDCDRDDFTAGGARFDVVFDMVPGSRYRDCLAVLKPGGRYVIGNPGLGKLLRAAWTSRFGGHRVGAAFAPETREQLEALIALVEDGRISSIVDTVHPLESAAAAHRQVEAERRVGAVVLSIP
ncbi:MAG: NAD(P)-dependent alcohol dehydrogenase [Gammaproteobacteria bacterium]|nr:NAD(P)-dependent alcohol dehydrogenase [Gammaproteobacteria bacterium]